MMMMTMMTIRVLFVDIRRVDSIQVADPSAAFDFNPLQTVKNHSFGNVLVCVVCPASDRPV